MKSTSNPVFAASRKVLLELCEGRLSEVHHAPLQFLTSGLVNSPRRSREKVLLGHASPDRVLCVLPQSSPALMWLVPGVAS